MTTTMSTWLPPRLPLTNANSLQQTQCWPNTYPAIVKRSFAFCTSGLCFCQRPETFSAKYTWAPAELRQWKMRYLGTWGTGSWLLSQNLVDGGVPQLAPVALGSCIHPNSKHTRTTSSTACSAVLVPCPQCCSLDMVMLTHIGRSCCRGVSPCRNKHFWENTGWTHASPSSKNACGVLFQTMTRWWIELQGSEGPMPGQGRSVEMVCAVLEQNEVQAKLPLCHTQHSRQSIWC